MDQQDEGIEMLIPFFYALIGLVLIGIDYLDSSQPHYGDPLAEMGREFGAILFTYFLSFGYLVLALLSSGMGWDLSERPSYKKGFKWVIGVRG